MAIASAATTNVRTRSVQRYLISKMKQAEAAKSLQSEAVPAPAVSFFVFLRAGYAPGWLSARVSVIKEQLLAEESLLLRKTTICFFESCRDTLHMWDVSRQNALFAPKSREITAIPREPTSWLCQNSSRMSKEFATVHAA
jgi:hypothetical protein